ncbi:MAG: Fur family transcriptional regulator [Candidatus Dormibacteria bacterium]
MAQPLDLADADRLRAAGLRVTAARLAVLTTLREGGHQGVDGIADGVRQRVGTISTQGVYDVLRIFTAVGLVRRIEPAGSPALYEARVGDNHHHLVCRSCGAVEDVDCAIGQVPCLQPASTAGYLIDEADVTYWGICGECRDPAPVGMVPGAQPS